MMTTSSIDSSPPPAYESSEQQQGFFGQALTNVFGGFGAAAGAGIFGTPQPVQQQQMPQPMQMQQMQQPTPQQMQMQQNSPTRRVTHTKPDIARLPAASPPQPGDAIAAIVVTICGGTSYDNLFSAVPQQSDEGTKVLAFVLDADAGVKRLQKALAGGGLDADAVDHPDTGDTAAMKELVEAIAIVRAEGRADCVVINFECCSAYGDHGFCRGHHGHQHTGAVSPDASIELIATAVAHGHLVMCSDFSLKALIAKWEGNAGLAARLGPCPLKKTGEFSGTMKLRFDPGQLQAAERSAQLQKVGELCDQGEVAVSCPGGTIGYGVDDTIVGLAAGTFALEVLTVIDPSGSGPRCPKQFRSTVAGVSGAAGHVMLTYPSGGALLASAGHWKSLMDMKNVSAERMFDVSAQAYGEEYTSARRAEWSALDSDAERRCYTSGFSAQMVQQSAPCKMFSPRPKKGF